MAVHLEFVVPGPPVSNQSPGPNLTTWRATVAGAATLNWPNLPLTGELKAIIINFWTGNKPSVDVDNLSKPILDAMRQIVYNDDRQIVQAEITHAKINCGRSPDHCDSAPGWESFCVRPHRRPGEPIPAPKVTP
jgi:hypothetical protein